MPTKAIIRVGDTLPHSGGAILIAESAPDRDGWTVILALKKLNSLDREYVVWNRGPAGQLQSGTYCPQWADAVIAYEKRLKAARGGRGLSGTVQA